MVFHAQLRHSQVWELNGSAHQYVCKQLHRVYGNQTFMLASTDPSFSWIVPQGLKTTDDIDWSVIYSDYLPIKYEINLAITDVRNSVDFAEKFNKSRPNCLALLFMGSFYAGWTQQNADVTKFLLQQQSNLLSGSRLEKWADLLNRSVALRDLCGFHSYIPQLVSHTIASLSTANQNSKLTQFFQLLLAQPDRLNVSCYPLVPKAAYFDRCAFTGFLLPHNARKLLQRSCSSSQNSRTPPVVQ